MSRFFLSDRSDRSRLIVPIRSLITQGSDYTFISLVGCESRRVITVITWFLAEPNCYPASFDFEEAKSLRGQLEVYNALTLLGKEKSTR